MTLRNLADALTTCQLPLPKKAAEHVALRDAIRAVPVDLEQPQQAIESMTVKNASAHVDRLVRQRVEEDARRLVTSQLAATAEAHAARAITAEADNLIAAYRPAFDAAAQTVATHAAAFAPGDDADSVILRGPDAANAWAQINQASAVLDAGLHLWSTLYEQPASSASVVATFDGDHWRNVDAQTALDEPNRWHLLAVAGYTLRLNTLTEVAALLQSTPEREHRYERHAVNGFRVDEKVRA